MSAHSGLLHEMHGVLYLAYTGQVPPPDVATGEDVGRVLGLLPRARKDRIDTRAGHRGPPVGPWHDAISVDLDFLAEIVGLPALRHAVREASDDDLHDARRAVAPITRGLETIASLAVAIRGWDQFLGFGIL